MAAQKAARKRLIAPRVRSSAAAARLVAEMRELGSDKVLPREVWASARQLPEEIAAAAKGR